VDVRIGIQASYSGGFRETAAEIRELESAGLDLATVAEVYTFDAVSQLGYLAAVTERVELMSGIVPIYSRTPALTAMTAAGLDFVSDGRFTLGLGASGPQVVEGWHGVPYDAPLQRTPRGRGDLPTGVAPGAAGHEGPKYTIPLPAEQGTGLGKPLKLINTPVRERIPVMLAALGPQERRSWPPRSPRLGARSGSCRARRRRSGAKRCGPGRPSATRSSATCRSSAASRCDRRGRRPPARDVRPQLALYVGGMGAKGKNFYNDLARATGTRTPRDRCRSSTSGGRKDEAAAALPTSSCGVSPHRPGGPTSAERSPPTPRPGVTTLALQPLDDSPESRLRTVETMREIADE
jgi:hypothetical protein